MSPYPILLVEDDENDVFFFERAVQIIGISNPVHVVKDGLQALDYLSGAGLYADRDQHPFPSAIVLDLNLPRKHGLEVLKWIRQKPQWAGLPVVVLTSSSSELDVTVAYRLGANSFFVKPTDPDQLAELLKVIHDYWFKWSRILTVPPT